MSSIKRKDGVSKEAQLTPRSDRKPQEVYICVPEWFDERKVYKIANAPARTASLAFPGADLNFAARVLYAEASGARALQEKDMRDQEKSAIIHVMHFRLNRKHYPSLPAISFTDVCKAPNQFDSMRDNNSKMQKSAAKPAEILPKAECLDLCEALAAVKRFIETGPDRRYQFDNFRSYRSGGEGDRIGNSRFWLSPVGEKLAKKTP